MVMTNHSSYRNSNEPMSIDSTELKDIEASATSLRKPVAEILETSSKPTQSSGEQNGRESRFLALEGADMHVEHLHKTNEL